MLKVLTNEQREFLYEEAEEVDVFQAEKYKWLLRTVGFSICVVILLSKYISLYYSGVVSLFAFIALGYIMKNPCYELECTVVKRKTGGKRSFLRKQMYVVVQTADGCVWTAKVSRRTYVLAKKGTRGCIYFNEKDISKNRPVIFKV